MTLGDHMNNGRVERAKHTKKFETGGIAPGPISIGVYYEETQGDDSCRDAA